MSAAPRTTSSTASRTSSRADVASHAELDPDTTLDDTTIDDAASSRQIRSAIMSMHAASAGASAVNRTRRVVRARASNLQTQRTRARSLWAPIAICSALFLITGAAVWSLFEQYDLASTGMVESGDHLFVMLLWFLPVSAALLALVWFRRNPTRPDRGFPAGRSLGSRSAAE